MLYTKPLFDQTHEFLLSLVDEFHVLDELSKLYVAVMGQEKRVPRFAQNLYEVCVVSGTDMSQFGMCGLDVGVNGSLHQLPQWLLVVGEQLQSTTNTLVVGTGQPRSCERAPSQNI